KEAVFDAEDTLAGSLESVSVVVEGLVLNRERAAAAASGLLLATDVADYLVGQGLPFRRSHELVGLMTRRLLEAGRDSGSLASEESQQYAAQFRSQVVTRISTLASVEVRQTQ